MTKLLVRDYPGDQQWVFDCDPLEFLNLMFVLPATMGQTNIIATDRYTLDMEHELTTRTKVKGARELGQLIVNSGDTLVTQANLDNWNDADIIGWLEAKGYSWDVDLEGWVIYRYI